MKSGAPRKRKRVPGAPDFGSSASISGGHLHQVPKPWVYRWPNDKGVRRSVRVDISTWAGMSIGASHFYAKIKEEPNSVWDTRDLAWLSDPRHPSTKERKFEADLFSREEAIRFVEAVVREFFSDEKLYAVSSKYGEAGIDKMLREIRKDGD